MSIIDETVDKVKLMTYIENAQDTDTLVVICEKFLAKYKPDKKELDVPESYTKVEVDPLTWKPKYGKDRTILTVSHSQSSVLPLNPVAINPVIKKLLCQNLTEEIFKTKYLDFQQHKDHLNDNLVTTARLGVYKP